MILNRNSKYQEIMQGYQEGKTQWQGITEIKTAGKERRSNKGRIADRQTDRQNDRRKRAENDVQRDRINSEKGKKKRPGMNPGLEELVDIKSAISN